MLPKRNRADKKAIEQVFKSGKFINSDSLTFKFIITSNPNPPKISFVVPKTVSKKAVERNLLRRRGYDALKGIFESLPSSLVGVFIFKKYQEDVLILEDEIKKIFNKMR